MDKLIETTLQRIGVDLAKTYDNSFSTKEFGGKAWPKRQIDIKGSLMNNTGTLRRSIKWKVTGRSLAFVSNLPYSKIQNEGGKIQVTRKMQKYFWAKYKELAGKVKRKKNGDPLKSSLGVSKVANYYRSLALKKVGTYITIPQRQFIGRTQETDKIVQHHIDVCIIIPLKEALSRTMQRK